VLATIPWIDQGELDGNSRLLVSGRTVADEAGVDLASARLAYYRSRTEN
jgi:hypothetical protein